ncbi:ketopantoate reductase family protein [Rheinheimera sp. WS51]|uniref:ketopantoate reductase family protein n=1 Tax=Rheinheimera sp. WS51 TaxID=3425886 RepID=UPI003D90ACBC
MASNSSSSSGLNWTIVGQGAIGLLAASRLSLSSGSVALHLRQPSSIEIIFTPVAGPAQSLQFAPAKPPYSTVLVPVKSYDVIAAVKQLLPNLSPDAQLVISHNGMGTIEPLLSLLTPNQGLWFLTTTHGALKTSANTIQHTGQGQSIAAPLNLAAKQHLAAIEKDLAIALGPLQLVPDIQPYLWQKLLINAVINPLTAINNCPNGDLLQEKFASTILQIVSEVCAVSQAAGYKMAIEESVQRVRHVMQATATNFSSMQQDVFYRRKTEIDAISGFIVNQGSHYNQATPLNLQLQQQVLQLQASYS